MARNSDNGTAGALAFLFLAGLVWMIVRMLLMLVAFAAVVAVVAVAAASVIFFFREIIIEARRREQVREAIARRAGQIEEGVVDVSLARSCAYCGATCAAGATLCPGCAAPVDRATPEKDEAAAVARATRELEQAGQSLATPGLTWAKMIGLGATALGLGVFAVPRTPDIYRSLVAPLVDDADRRASVTTAPSAPVAPPPAAARSDNTRCEIPARCSTSGSLARDTTTGGCPDPDRWREPQWVRTVRATMARSVSGDIATILTDDAHTSLHTQPRSIARLSTSPATYATDGVSKWQWLITSPKPKPEAFGPPCSVELVQQKRAGQGVEMLYRITAGLFEHSWMTVDTDEVEHTSTMVIESETLIQTASQSTIRRHWSCAELMAGCE